MLRKTMLGAASVAALLSAAPEAAAQCSPATSPGQRPVERELGAPAPLELRELLDNPTSLYSTAEREQVGGDEHLVAEAAMHAVYRVPMEYFASAVTDLGEHDRFLPSVTFSSELCRNEGPPAYSRQRITTSFGVLFFRATYDNVVDVFVSREPSVPSLVTWHSLHESLDGKLEGQGGLWYVEEVMLDGSPATYVYRASRIVFADEPLGLRAALNAFSDNQLEALFEAVREEANRRRSEAMLREHP